MSLSQNREQAAPQANKRRSNNWPKGVSGNPRGSSFPAGALRAAEERLLAAIYEDVGGTLNALDMALAKQAAQQLARAEFTKAPDIQVRLTREACRLVDRIRNGIAARKEASPITAFDKYVAEKAAQR